MLANRSGPDQIGARRSRVCDLHETLGQDVGTTSVRAEGLTLHSYPGRCVKPLSSCINRLRHLMLVICNSRNFVLTMCSRGHTTRPAAHLCIVGRQCRGQRAGTGADARTQRPKRHVEGLCRPVRHRPRCGCCQPAREIFAGKVRSKCAHGGRFGAIKPALTCADTFVASVRAEGSNPIQLPDQGFRTCPSYKRRLRRLSKLISAHARSTAP